jgi:hypothetical protein
VPVPVVRSLAGATFRANPRRQFVPRAAFSPREVRFAAGRTSESAAVGVLRSRDTLDSVLTLIDSAALGVIERGVRPHTPDAVLARLVLDGALEVESSGGFVCGPAAFGTVVERFDAGGTGTIAALSRAAIAYGAALRTSEANDLSVRLYCYGRRPASPRWRRALPQRDSVADLLDFRVGLPGAKSVRAAWQGKQAHDGWFSWYRRKPGAAGASPAYKLYVSPQTEALSATFPAIAAALADSEAVSFKIGADAFGVLRPDKLVAYFPTLASLHAAADGLAARLAGAAAHGVPFTCAIGDDGMLSWGSDPVSDSTSRERESWRLWITNRLADALLHAKAAPSDAVPAETFALARVALDGVDPDTWTPRSRPQPDADH